MPAKNLNLGSFTPGVLRICFSQQMPQIALTQLPFKFPDLSTVHVETIKSFILHKLRENVYKIGLKSLFFRSGNR